MSTCQQVIAFNGDIQFRLLDLFNDRVNLAFVKAEGLPCGWALSTFSKMQQTEKFTESLTEKRVTDDEDSGDGENQLKPSAKKRMTIEEALASANSRRSRTQVSDYSKMKLKATELYGESTASDASGSDGSVSAPDASDFSDDDSTLRAAMKEELHDRNKQDAAKFLPDPEELRKLEEERTMDVDDVLRRLEEEGTRMEEDGPENEVESRPKRVQFDESENLQKQSSSKRSKPDPGEDADDDADASDVEDYDDSKDHSDEEFEATEAELANVVVKLHLFCRVITMH